VTLSEMNMRLGYCRAQAGVGKLVSRELSIEIEVRWKRGNRNWSAGEIGGSAGQLTRTLQKSRVLRRARGTAAAYFLYSCARVGPLRPID